MLTIAMSERKRNKRDAEPQIWVAFKTHGRILKEMWFADWTEALTGVSQIMAEGGPEVPDEEPE